MDRETVNVLVAEALQLDAGRKILRHLDEASVEAGVNRPPPVDAAPALPSSDQKSFNESLRTGVRGLGELVRNRKKKK
jgi:hypothetical protein